MIKGIKLNRKTFIRWKIYIDRARMYIGYVQFFMIGLVLFESVKDQEIGKIFYQYLYLSIPILFLIFIAFSLVLGYLDTRLGFKEEEQRNLSYSNPIMMDILKSVKEMEKEIKALKEEKTAQNL
jgi:preprotein translocase subunit SecG